MMQKTKNRRTIHAKTFVTVAALSVLLCACGSGKSANSAGAAASEPREPEVAVEEAANDMADYDAGSYSAESSVAAAVDEKGFDAPPQSAVGDPGAGEGSAPQSQDSARKLIKIVDISLETEGFDALVPDIQTQVEALGGYIERIVVYDVDNYTVDGSSKARREASMTARIPKEKLEGFLSHVGERGNVTYHAERVEDVTLQYVDLDSRKKALLTEQERLLALLEKAETVEDLIAIESRLSEVRYQIESMVSQLRTYDNQIDYSTVNLTIGEVRRYSATESDGILTRIGKGFRKSAVDLVYGLRDFAVGILIDLPYIFFWLTVLVVALLLLRAILWKVWKIRFLRRVKKAKSPLPEAERRKAFFGKKAVWHGDREDAGDSERGSENGKK